MPSVTEFIVDQATVRFGDDDDPFEVVYRPSILNPNRTKYFLDDIKENDALAVAYLLAGSGPDDQLVVSWNLTGPLMGWRNALDVEGNEVKDRFDHPIREQYELVAKDAVIPISVEVLQFIKADTLVGVYGEIQKNSQSVTSANFTRTTTPSSNGSRKRS